MEKKKQNRDLELYNKYTVRWWVSRVYVCVCVCVRNVLNLPFSLKRKKIKIKYIYTGKSAPKKTKAGCVTDSNTAAMPRRWSPMNRLKNLPEVSPAAPSPGVPQGPDPLCDVSSTLDSWKQINDTMEDQHLYR